MSDLTQAIIEEGTFLRRAGTNSCSWSHLSTGDQTIVTPFYPLQCDIGQPVTTPSLEETQPPLTHEERCHGRIVREKYTANSMYIVPYNEKQTWFVCV